MVEHGRRTFLTRTVAMVVMGFDTRRRTWGTETEAATGPVVAVPGLDGELITDPASLDEAADDFGPIMHRRPLAVLRPGSYGDI
jgi:hypothetical protein